MNIILFQLSFIVILINVCIFINTLLNCLNKSIFIYDIIINLILFNMMSNECTGIYK